MFESPKLYVDDGLFYEADTCKPLKDNWKAGKLSMEAWGRFNYPGSLIPDNVLPQLSSIGYWDANTPQTWGLDWHRNEGLEITFLERGNITFSLSGFKHILQANELTLTRPWQPHKLGDPNINVSRLYWLILDLDVRYPHQKWKWPDWIMLTANDLSDLTRMLRENEQPVWQANTDISTCFAKLGNLLKTSKKCLDESMLIIRINEILAYLLRMFREGGIQLDNSLTGSRRTVEIFIKHLENNFMESWDVESMSAYCGLGVTQFTHYVSQATNMTPVQYLNYIRLTNSAKLLLTYPTLNIKEICYRCGFTSTEYFSVVFKKHFKCSPTIYRTQKLLKY